MATAYVSQQWNHTASLQATLINLHTTEDSDPVTPEELHPLIDTPETRPPDVPQEMTFSVLAAAFLRD